MGAENRFEAWGRERKTAEFLAARDGVLEAIVWTTGETLVARVVVDETCLDCESRLKVACKLTLGDDHTPKVILMERQRKNAA